VPLSDSVCLPIRSFLIKTFFPSPSSLYFCHCVALFCTPANAGPPRPRGDSRPAVKGVLGALVCGAASALFVMGLVKGGAGNNQRTALLPEMQAHVKVQTHDHGALLLQATHSAPVKARQNRLASAKLARQQSFKQRQLAALRTDARSYLMFSSKVAGLLVRSNYITNPLTRCTLSIIFFQRVCVCDVYRLFCLG
jgi:hypothetical protein